MSTIARQIAGASPAERLAEFQRIEPSLRKQFQEHLVKEGRPADFDKEFPAILEQAKERALASPTFGQQAARHAADCRCESHAPAPRQQGDTVRRIAGSAPLAQVDTSKVTERELTAAMESAVKPKFVKWCAEEKVADSETEWKAKLPKLTEDFKASKHFGRSILAVRESHRRCEQGVQQVKMKFDKWAAEQGLAPEEAARQWVNVEAQAQKKLEGCEIGQRHEQRGPALKETTTAGSIPSSALANASKGQAKKYGSWERRNGRAYERTPNPNSSEPLPYNINPSYEERQARHTRQMDDARTGDPHGRSEEEKRREKAELALRRRARGEFKTESRPTSARSMIDSALDR